MKKEFWEDRYASKDLVYGKEPNAWFKECLKLLEPGKALFPAEGEGRNAVHAALKGWEVHAFDQSENAKRKALEMAEENDVTIDYQVSDLLSHDMGREEYDMVVSIYVHMDPILRKKVHRRYVKALKKGGYLVLEGFSKEQIGYRSGGPPNIDMLFSEKDLRRDFSDLTFLRAETTEVTLKEGKYHDGPASVIRLLGQKE